MDLVPSLAALVGQKVPDGLDGIENLDAFMGKGASKRKDLVIEAKSKLAYRTGPWVMIPPHEGKERNVTGNELGNLKEYGLFDLTKDPAQVCNVASQYPDVLEALRKEFEAQTDGQVRNAPPAPVSKKKK